METILENRVKENSPNTPKVSINPLNRVKDLYSMGERSLKNGIAILEEWVSKPSPRWVLIDSYRLKMDTRAHFVPRGREEGKDSSSRRTP